MSNAPVLPGDRLRELIAEMRSKSLRWTWYDGSPDVIYAERIDQFADDLEAIAGDPVLFTHLQGQVIEGLKAEGQKDAWIEMLSDTLRRIVVAAGAPDDWEGSVADAIDFINQRFVSVQAELDQLRAAVPLPPEITTGTYACPICGRDTPHTHEHHLHCPSIRCVCGHMPHQAGRCGFCECGTFAPSGLCSCSNYAAVPLPPSDGTSLVERLENYYAFECEGGPLRNCVEWQQLKSLIAAVPLMLDRPELIGPATHYRPEPIGSAGPIPLNDTQQRAAKEWAADDRLWTTQETVEHNLRTFARTILRDADSAAVPREQEKPQLYRMPQYDILQAMTTYGGGFVQQLARLFWAADTENQKALEQTFRHYFVQYDELAAKAASTSVLPREEPQP